MLGPTSPTALSLPSSAAPIPDSGEASQIPTAASAAVAEDNPDQEDPDPTRESKRRKYCPKALEKVEELLLAADSNPNLSSFSFDTKFAACSPEITPKFGSFNLVVPSSDQKNRSCEKKEEETNTQSGSLSEAVGESNKRD